jgi:hypothetical protein
MGPDTAAAVEAAFVALVLFAAAVAAAAAKMRPAALEVFAGADRTTRFALPLQR